MIRGTDLGFLNQSLASRPSKLKRNCVSRYSLKKRCTFCKQACALFDETPAACGELGAASIAGTGLGCGQSTAEGGASVAHPLKVSTQVNSISQRSIARATKKLDATSSVAELPSEKQNNPRSELIGTGIFLLSQCGTNWGTKSRISPDSPVSQGPDGMRTLHSYVSFAYGLRSGLVLNSAV